MRLNPSPPGARGLTADIIKLQPSHDRHRYPIAQQKQAVQEILLHCLFFCAQKSPAAGAAGPKLGVSCLGAILATSGQTLVIGDAAVAERGHASDTEVLGIVEMVGIR